MMNIKCFFVYVEIYLGLYFFNFGVDEMKRIRVYLVFLYIDESLLRILDVK